MAADQVQRVRIYLSRSDQWEGRPLYLAVLDLLRRSGATGATALQGLAGFGPGQRTRAGGLDRPEDHQPVLIEWIDRAERVQRLLPLLDELIGSALVTVEEIPVHRALLRARGPFAADRSVGDMMQKPARAVAAGAPLSEALALMLEYHLGTVPVVDVEGRLIGLIGEQELAWRAGLRVAPRLIGLLRPVERDGLLAPLIGRGAAEVMSPEPRSVFASTAIPQALITMIEWGYSEVPVVDRDGRLVGSFGQDQVLQAAIEHAGQPEGGVRDAEPPASVGLVMQTIAPQVASGHPLPSALAQLLAASGRRLLVTDGAGRLLGGVDLAAALAGLNDAERAALLAALQRREPPAPATLPGAGRTIDELVTPVAATIGPESTAIEAARRLLDLGAESLVVVQAEQQFVGIIARSGLVRALMQQSE